MFEPDVRFVQAKEPIAATIDEEVVMLSAANNAYFSFNGVASDIWRLLTRPARFDEICQALADEYDVDQATLARDVASFLKATVERGLAKQNDPGMEAS